MLAKLALVFLLSPAVFAFEFAGMSLSIEKVATDLMVSGIFRQGGREFVINPVKFKSVYSSSHVDLLIAETTFGDCRYPIAFQLKIRKTGRKDYSYLKSIAPDRIFETQSRTCVPPFGFDATEFVPIEDATHWEDP